MREGLGIAGLVFSCLFLAELGASIWAFGLRFVLVFSIPLGVWYWTWGVEGVRGTKWG